DAPPCRAAIYCKGSLPHASYNRRTTFFFSSRRRHTRWPRDWSSDVCSSDLGQAREPAEASFSHDVAPFLKTYCTSCHGGMRPRRSEERRVGKEGRSRWSTYDKKKKRREE